MKNDPPKFIHLLTQAKVMLLEIVLFVIFVAELWKFLKWMTLGSQNLLCMPILDDGGRVFAVAQLLNKASGSRPFDAADERRFRDFIAKMGVILESWTQLSDGP